MLDETVTTSLYTIESDVPLPPISRHWWTSTKVPIRQYGSESVVQHAW